MFVVPMQSVTYNSIDRFVCAVKVSQETLRLPVMRLVVDRIPIVQSLRPVSTENVLTLVNERNAVKMLTVDRITITVPDVTAWMATVEIRW